MKTEDALKALMEKGYLWDLGQLSAAAKREILKKDGVSKKIALWPWFHTGTCRKTVYTME